MTDSTNQNKALTLDIADGFAILTFDTPHSRANTLGRAILEEFETIVKDLQGRSDLQGLIMQSGKPGMFVAGADLNELGKAEGDPEQTREMVQRGLDVISAFENLPYPSVAMIDGSCLGGGAELSLGFDYRLAGSHQKCEFGFPEVKVGLIPGWGGTQRITRIIGPSQAAELVCSGDSIKADKARDMGIVFDKVPSEHLMDEAKRLLAWTRESGEWQQQRKKKRQPVGLSEDQLAFTYAVAKGYLLSKTKGQMPAPLSALEAIIKGCNLPLEDGLKIETDHFVPLAGSPISKNLIAIFFMNQKLQKDSGIQEKHVKPKEVARVGVVGAGLMGAGIAGAHIRRYIHTLMLDNVPHAVENGVHSITKMLQTREKIGRMTEREVLAAFSKLNTSTDQTLLADRDVVIEAIVENEEVKKNLFRELGKIIKPDAILASNTSTISITRMAESAPHPEQFAGMHFFNPVDRMPLVEVIRGEKTNDETVVTLVSLAKHIKKTPIVVRDCPGFLVNRILFPYINEALVLLEHGADPRKIDKASTAFGMPMGPITLNDLVGLDTSLFAGKVVNDAYSDRAETTSILEELVNAGRLGKKSGAGFYAYANGGRGKDDPEFHKILEECLKEQASFSEEELTDRLFLPMLTEASRILMENIVRSPSDVDMGLIMGIGFPAFRGGLLRWADTVGLDKIVEKLSKYEQLGPRFHPTEQMKKLAAEGKGFYSEF